MTEIRKCNRNYFVERKDNVIEKMMKIMDEYGNVIISFNPGDSTVDIRDRNKKTGWRKILIGHEEFVAVLNTFRGAYYHPVCIEYGTQSAFVPSPCFGISQTWLIEGEPATRRYEVDVETCSNTKVFVDATSEEDAKAKVRDMYSRGVLQCELDDNEQMNIPNVEC